MSCWVNQTLGHHTLLVVLAQCWSLPFELQTLAIIVWPSTTSIINRDWFNYCPLAFSWLPSCSFDIFVFCSPIPLSFPATSNTWYMLMKTPTPGDATRPGLPFLENLTEDSRELQQSYRTAEVVEVEACWNSWTGVSSSFLWGGYPLIN